MTSKAKQHFLKSVLDQVVFVFDHKAIRQELLEHMEDLEEHFEQQDLDKDQADEKILFEMGDPEEIGQALNQVHNPWLGWLWVVSNIILVLLIGTLLAEATNRQLEAMRYTREINNPEVDYSQVFSYAEDPAPLSAITRFNIHEPFVFNDKQVILEDIGYHTDGRLVILYQVVRNYDFLDIETPLPNLSRHSRLILEDGSELLPANADPVVALGSDLFAVFFIDLTQMPTSFSFRYEESVLGFEYHFEVNS